MAASLQIKHLNIDASPDSLLLESDPDLKYYREVHRHYGTDEYIIVGYKPNAGLLDQETIALLEEISNKFKKIEAVSGVAALSNVPLLLQLEEDEKTGNTKFSNLLSPQVDVDKARQEFTSSPIYVDNLVSRDLSTTAIKIDIQKNQELIDLLQQKYVLLEQQDAQALDQEKNSELESIREEILTQRKFTNERYKSILFSVRSIIDEYAEDGEFYLAGAPLIGNDMKVFVVQDIKVFGIAILVIMVFVLFMFFRKPAWIFWRLYVLY